MIQELSREVTIRPLKPSDLPRLNRLFDSFSEDDRRLFHPGHIGYRPKTPLWVAVQIIILMNTSPALRSVFKRLTPSLARLYLIATDSSGRALGMVFLSFRGGQRRLGYASNLGIGLRHSERSKGLGTALVGAVLDAAKFENVKLIYLTVMTDNTPALKLYNRFGFKPIRKLHELWKGELYEAVEMILRLGAE